jgi:hypothetical protein
MLRLNHLTIKSINMQKIVIVIICFVVIQSAKAQLKTTPICPNFVVDVLEGAVNDLYIKAVQSDIKPKFPCFSEVVEETTGLECGRIVYKEKGITFFTERNYIEINDKFKGTLKPQLMGKNRNGLFTLLGHPKIKDINWDAFQTKYGTLILYYNKAGKINKLQMSTNTTETIKLCE